MSLRKPDLDLRERFAGLLLGTAVGDALGLPAEGVSRGRINRLWRVSGVIVFFLAGAWSATTLNTHDSLLKRC